MEYAVELEDISKIYKLKNEGKRGRARSFYALKDIGLYIKKGESIAILGTKDSGKTTLLEIIAGIIKPDRGTVITNGHKEFISVNSKLNNKLTGLENINEKAC